MRLSNLARACLRFKIRLYCFALTYSGSSSASIFTSSAVVVELAATVADVAFVENTVSCVLAKFAPLNIVVAVFVGKMVAMLFGVAFAVAAVASIIIGACWPLIGCAVAVAAVGVVPGICIRFPFILMICDCAGIESLIVCIG